MIFEKIVLRSIKTVIFLTSFCQTILKLIIPVIIVLVMREGICFASYITVTYLIICLFRYLQGNKISKIPSNTFRGLSNLVEL